MKDQSNAEQMGVGQRGVVIAYLSYAMDDVKALSPTALYLLSMSIEALNCETGASKAGQQAVLDPRH